MRQFWIAILLSACGDGKLLQTPPDGSVEGGYTWWDDVQSIVEAKCQQCHSNPTRLAAVGSLVTYQDTQAPSTQGVPMHLMMAHRVRDDRRPMPPPSQSALTAEEIGIIEAWSSGGAKEGDPPGSTYFVEVQPILRTRCGFCHGSVPANGAPRSLASYSDLTVMTGAGEPVYQVVARRVMQGTMPP